MSPPFPSHPLRLLFLSAIAGIGIIISLLFTVLQWQNALPAGVTITPIAHTDAEWERKRLYAIEKMERRILPRAPDAPLPSADATLVRTLNSLRRRIEERYDVRIIMFDPAFLKEEGIDANPYPLVSLQEHLQNLNDWIRMYPPEYIHHIGLKTIAIFKGWEQESVQTAGFLLDRSSIGIEANPAVFHHELFHLADLNDGGIENDNTDWLRGKYGNNIPQQSSFDSLHAISKNLYGMERPLGFVNAYGKYGGVDEDQASVAEYLMFFPEHIRQWENQDHELSKSIHMMKEFFAVHSDGLIDDAFWHDQEKGVRISDNYWDDRRNNSRAVSSELAAKLLTASKLEEARALIAEGNSASAEAIFLELISKEPDRTSLVNELGSMYEDDQQYAKAVDLYLRTLGTTQDPHFDLKIARNLKSLEQNEDAIRYYTNAYRLGYLIGVEVEDFIDLYERHAATLARSGKYTEAASAYHQMIRIFGDRKQWQDAAESAQRANMQRKS